MAVGRLLLGPLEGVYSIIYSLCALRSKAEEMTAQQLWPTHRLPIIADIKLLHM